MKIEKTDRKSFYLEEYSLGKNKTSRGGSLYRVLTLASLGVFTGMGLFLSQVDTSKLEQALFLKKMDVSFFVKEEPKAKAPEPKKEKPKPKPVKPIEKPALEEAAKEPQKVAEKKPRKVYGVRKLYSKGLGNGEGGSDALVGKLGNSLDVPPDTLKASEEDIKGKVVSVTRISKMPKIKVAAKPEYTDEMKKNQVIGKVKARVLVDVDGCPKKIVILADLGFGTRQSSIEAIKKMKFEPGILDDAPVAVWIPLTFRFEFQA